MPRAKAKGNGARPTVPRKAAQKIHEPLPKRPQLIYALKQWSAERRKDGWYVSPTTSAVVGNKPEWRGPFQSIENACLAIARQHAVELADRHTRHIEFHKIDKSDPLYGLQPNTHL